METVGFCVRVQALEGYGDKISSLAFHEDYTGLLSVKHKGGRGENPHYHIVVRTSVKQQAFRVRMKKLFPEGAGNQHMSIKCWDGNNDALSYLFHEDPEAPVVVVKNINDLDAIKRRNLEVQQEVAKAKVKSSHLLLDLAVEHFTKNPIKKYEDVEVVIATFMLLTAMREGKYPPNAFHLKSMVALTIFKLKDGDTKAEEEYAKNMAQNIFRRLE